MHIDIIRQKLAQLIQQSPEWMDKLNDTEPGHYGLEDWDVEVSENDVIANIPKRTFSFRGVSFSFEIHMGSSNSDDGFISSFSRTAEGDGTFEFVDNANDIAITDLNIKVDLDLFSE